MSRCSWWELLCAALALGCLLGVAGVKPMVRWLDPGLAVAAAFAEDETVIQNEFDWATRPQGDGPFYGVRAKPSVPLDPWGNAWAYRTWRYYKMSPGRVDPYSRGPDGRDDECRGDDVLPKDRGTAAVVLIWSRVLCAALALCFAWLARLPRLLWGEQAGLARELLRASTLASVPAALLAAGVLRSQANLDGVMTGLLLVPSRVALAGSLALGCLLGATWWRLTRPRREDPGQST